MASVSTAPRLFVDPARLASEGPVFLSGAEHHYLTRVLRLRVGDAVVLLAQHSQPLPLATNVRDGWASPYVLGLLVCFMLNAILVVVFITRISHNLRRRDARLAAVRQRAAEEEHIVRMGLLASGAAHELGTPLSSLSVILGDWARTPQIASDADMMAELREMQSELARCKAILSSMGG